MARMILATAVPVLLSVATPVGAGDAHWDYGNDHGGPKHWSELSPAFAECGVGKHQSPIDIRDAATSDLPSIEFAYQPGHPKVTNNGHTIEVEVPAGSSITVGDHRYDLVQFHFHSPAEEAVEGKRAPLVAHFVHKDSDGKLAVVAVEFDVGAESAALKPIFARMPSRAGKETELADVQVDPSALLPAKRSYYEFEGSLTTPPCSEGVRWFVLQQHPTVSKAELSEFKALYPGNARPLQPANGRPIHASK